MTAPARPLRVVHLGKFYPPATGGMESHLQTLAREQAHLGADVEVLCINHRDAAGRDVTDEAVAVTPTTDEQDGGGRRA